MERQHRAYEQNESVPITCETGYQAQDDHLICQEGNWTLNGTSLETATLQHICTRESFKYFCFIRGSYKKITGCNLMLSMFLSFAATEMPCGHPPKFENAVVVTSYQQKFLSGSAVTYQCRARYIMDEENTGTLQCIDGEWEKKSITCTCKYIEKLSQCHRPLLWRFQFWSQMFSAVFSRFWMSSRMYRRNGI